MFGFSRSTGLSIAATLLVAASPAFAGPATPSDRDATMAMLEVPPAQQSDLALVVTPTAPPPPRSEVVPPPPADDGELAWQPGHWRWNAAAADRWEWQAGRYVRAPHAHMIWIAGHWEGGPSAQWVWVAGFWGEGRGATQLSLNPAR
jgi:hypothetical protein